MLRLALVAVLLHAFAPIASHAMMATSGKSFMEICTAQGFQLIEVDDSVDGKSMPSIKVGHECAVCAVASASPAPTSDYHFVPVLQATGHVVMLSSSTFAFANALHLSPPPTGPPTL